MNTNRLKKFAQETRKKLLEQVHAKVDYVITIDTPELREKAALVATIKDEITARGKQQLVDKVAYTWFNRFLVLRYMDVNDYQPLGIKIVSALPRQVSPQILQEAFAGHIPKDLNINPQKMFDLLDGRTESRNAENEAYRHLLISACNYLNRIFPFLFERINDYTELLLPDDLTSQFSVLHDLVLGMTEEDCSQVECIGWLYQFYISEKKDEVFAAKNKVKKEDIPAATQLFTPRWIVEYMVQNTVGKIWMQNHPNSRLKQHMPYYLETEAGQTGDYLKISSPEELTLLDQACGSGHILVYGFELLYKIYEEQGYNPSEIPTLIIKNNLFGFEIDSRAAQLAGMAVLLKAREYSNRLFRKAEILEPQILCFSDHHLSSVQIKEAFTKLGIKLSDELHHDLNLMSQATNLGSLIAPHSNVQELIAVKEQLTAKEAAADLFLRNQTNQLLTAFNQLIKLSKKYCCVVDNPPYMGGGAMNTELTNFVRNYYPDSKADLMTCFMEAGLNMLTVKGALGMINLPSWMFLSSFIEFRQNLIKKFQIDSLLHLGRGIFGSDFGSVAFVIYKKNPKNKGTYRRLFKEHVHVRSVEKIKSFFLDPNFGLFVAHQKDYEKIPGNPIGYWLSEKTLAELQAAPLLIEYGKATKGLDTCDNERFVRYWFEVSHHKFSDKRSLSHKWFIYHKGGEFRKWYGNIERVVNWERDGLELRNFKNPNGSQKSRPQNISKYFQEGITWSSIGSGEISYRFMYDSIFGGGGNGFFPKKEMLLYILGFLNSKTSKYFLNLFNPTLNNLTGDLHKLPVIGFNQAKELITDSVKQCVEISEAYWHSTERSWKFKANELLRVKSQDDIDLEEAFDLYKQYWQRKFSELHKIENKLNKDFIEIYELKEILTSDISNNEITILKEEVNLESGQLLFNSFEIFGQFISYSVGCMFGRYSIYNDGIVIASQSDTVKVLSKEINKPSENFLPDNNNIIPILEDDWFEDDIVAKFQEFLKVSFGEKSFRKNLNFLEESIGMSIRKYFVKEFYSNHIQRYKKRPIYWMFSSPKGHFNVLIYMHRYTPDSLNTLLNNYLRAFMEKLKVRMETLKHIETTGFSAEKTRALKEMDKISAMLLDCHDYERNILYPLAAERIAIDLDNGVLVNYNCFGKAIKEVAGLNDAKTKKKVKEFDWIDSQIIR